MHEVIITAAQPLALIDMPRSVSVISADDISRSGAKSIQELLATQANIVLSSFSGNEKFTRIDIRGSGDTSVSNVLTLVDGMRINTPDLSGTDFSTISLHQIERIEIVRGANSVRFGSGASQGVINIITKRPLHSSATIQHLTGSFDSENQVFSATAASELISVNATRIAKKDGGFRQHNTLSSDDMSLQLRAQSNDRSTLLSIKHQQHSDHYQLPGPLSLSGLQSGIVDRRQGSIAKGTEGETEDNSQHLQIRHRFASTANAKSTDVDKGRDRNASLRINLQHRERDNLFVFGQQFAAVDQARRDRIALQQDSADLALSFSPVQLPLAITTGFDYHDASYRRSNGGQSALNRQNHIGVSRSRAMFVHGDFNVNESLSLSAGYRIDKSNNRYTRTVLEEDESSPNCVVLSPLTTRCPVADLEKQRSDDKWRNEAFEFGLVYTLNDNARLYSSVAKTFRKPNVDELALPLTTTGNTRLTLIPQTARRFELGAKYQGDNSDIHVALFSSNTYDEIIYRAAPQSFNALSLGNFNFPQTIERQGLEIELTYYPHTSIALDINLGLVDATTPDGSRIPLTAKLNSSLSLRWQPLDYFWLSWTSQYSSDRVDGNNFNSANVGSVSSVNAQNLPSYWLSRVRAELRLPLIPVTGFIGINNVFDEHFVTAAYSGQAYPGNGQFVYGGFRVDI